MSDVVSALLMLTIVVWVLMSYLNGKVRLGWHRLFKMCALALVLGPGTGAVIWALSKKELMSTWPLVAGTIAGVTAAVLMVLVGMLQMLGQGGGCQHEHGGRADSPLGGSDPGEKVD